MTDNVGLHGDFCFWGPELARAMNPCDAGS
jgi:hypothetical protein